MFTLCYFSCIFYERPLMPFIFQNLLLVHFLNSNFQPSTPLATFYMGNSAYAKKIGAIQLGGGGGANHLTGGGG